MDKVTTHAEIGDLFHDGMTIMVGGFMGTGAPEGLVRILMDRDIKDITLISSDTALMDTGVGPLVLSRRLKKVIASHIGTNPETGRQMLAGELAVELVPQGTLAERVRAGGAGLGGILTPTGTGTMVAENKQTLTIEGREYLVELPLRADVALLKAHKADKSGNLVYRNSARNFNPLMALAADLVIVQVDEIVETGELDPNIVVTPGVLVDKIICYVEGE
ncbi:acetate CoA-transferase subunit alpha [Paenibacillus sp. MMS20-IR301]|uniref:acetate CoA-transferase subunit alpha n=1 Tax=Paenibacillus sp. MMS20-IR301 TaxID=2895946 RepID=UPI0028E63E97|nr:acetate CoA-transferase subunit alpha [Paenibacillus sp. MMS20-IR301]WNS44226.1 acetate CoA-transferase subunit alpha [Paenibacillus sp. MMS20-IR301]